MTLLPSKIQISFMDYVDTVGVTIHIEGLPIKDVKNLRNLPDVIADEYRNRLKLSTDDTEYIESAVRYYFGEAPECDGTCEVPQGNK